MTETIEIQSTDVLEYSMATVPKEPPDAVNDTVPEFEVVPPGVAAAVNVTASLA